MAPMPAPPIAPTLTSRAHPPVVHFAAAFWNTAIGGNPKGAYTYVHAYGHSHLQLQLAPADWHFGVGRAR